jgi:hypothetical protein
MILESLSTAGRVRREFAPRGVQAGTVVLFDEASALALIRRAEEERIAIAGVDQVRAEGLCDYDPLRGHALSPLERLSSWRQARLFVEGLAGRGLLFDVVLESPWRSYLALWRSGRAGPVT